MNLLAIDILLDPDETMLTRAATANARLRDAFPSGFELDDDHAPHITLLQRFVRSADLEQVENAVEQVLAAGDPASLKLEATGCYYLPWRDLGLAGITVARTPALVRLQHELIEAVAPFSARGGDADAFVGAPDTPTIVPTAA